MDAPDFIAHLLRGDPASSLGLSSFDAPYNEAIHAILGANGQGRDGAWHEWLATREPADQVSLQHAIDLAILALVGDGQPVTPLAEGTVSAYLRQTRTLADALSPWERLPDIVEGVLPARSLSIVFGPPGSHKTNLMLDLGLAVATGRPWLPGLPGVVACPGNPVNQHPVLWVDADSGQDVLQERLAAFARAYEAPLDTPFHWLTFPTPPIQAAKGLEDFITYTNRLGAKLVVMDNLLRFGGFKDENSSEVDVAMLALRMVAEATGAAVVLIHHRRKQVQADRAGDTMRGHGSIEGAIDAGLMVTRQAKSNVLQVTCTKARRKPIEDFAAEWIYEEQEDGKTLHTARFFRSDEQSPKESAKEAAQVALKQRIIRVVREEGPLNKSKTLSLVGGRKAETSVAMDELADAGILTVADGPHGSKLYTVTDN